MAKFTKKRITIEAVQWDGTDAHDAVERFLSTPEGDETWSSAMADAWGVLAGEFYGIRTLAGVMTLSSGDWIIKGVKGEFYPCKHDIFEMTYDPAPEAINAAD